MSEIFVSGGEAIFSTAQILHSHQTFQIGRRRVVLQQAPGVCGSNYYIEFGATVLPKALAKLRRRGNPLTSAVEFGVGKGVYVTLLSTLSSMQQLWGCDINPRAVALTKENLRRNGAKRFRIVRESVERALQKSWQTDLIAFDLPLIPLASVKQVPRPLWPILVGAGKTGRRFFDLIIRSAAEHLHPHGGIFFVQPSFIKGGFERTQQYMQKHGLKPWLLAEKKKYVAETILTQNLRPAIEMTLQQKFPRDKKGYYFMLQAVLGIRSLR